MWSLIPLLLSAWLLVADAAEPHERAVRVSHGFAWVGYGLAGAGSVTKVIGFGLALPLWMRTTGPVNRHELDAGIALWRVGSGMNALAPWLVAGGALGGTARVRALGLPVAPRAGEAAAAGTVVHAFSFSLLELGPDATEESATLLGALRIGGWTTALVAGGVQIDANLRALRGPQHQHARQLQLHAGPDGVALCGSW